MHLHRFSDSSTQIYCGVVYLRVQTSTGIKLFFLNSKTKAAPSIVVAVSLLELLGCVILSNFISQVLPSLINGVFCWTASEVVLCWIKGK